MTKETLLEVVDKLTGICYPYGDTSIDEERYENLELKIALVSHLFDHIEEAGELYDRHEFSIKKISGRANEFLADVRDALLEIEYLPPIESETDSQDDEDLISRRGLEQRVQVISYQDEWGETVMGEFVSWEDIEDAPNVVPLTNADGDIAVWRSDVLGAIAECQDIDDKAKYNVLAEVFGKVLELPPAVDIGE